MDSEEGDLYLTQNQGTLDNTTILRFTHALSAGAGIEVHLENLNKALLARNEMRIIYLYLPTESSAHREELAIGKGSLVKIPLMSKTNQTTSTSKSIKKQILERLTTHNGYLFFHGIYQNVQFLFSSLQFLLNPNPKRFSFMPRFREAKDISLILNTIFSSYHIDLVVNHFSGGRDSYEVMTNAHRRNIPILVMNHFNNVWFNYVPIRQQLTLANAAAGLSRINVPHYLRSKYVNLSNGIDTDFFNPDRVSKKPLFKYPALLLPARVVREKGHMDLLEVVKNLKTSGLECCAIFAGRIDMPDFKRELDAYIDTHKLVENCIFTGTLDPEALRSMYAGSTLVVLPTYFEGLGRVLIEAQAMKVPPVAYRSGGVPDAVRENESGLLVKRGDKWALYRAIVELLKDDQKRKEFGSNGRDFAVKQFSLTALASRHEHTYSHLISCHP